MVLIVSLEEQNLDSRITIIFPCTWSEFSDHIQIMMAAGIKNYFNCNEYVVNMVRSNPGLKIKLVVDRQTVLYMRHLLRDERFKSMIVAFRGVTVTMNSVLV